MCNLAAGTNKETNLGQRDTLLMGNVRSLRLLTPVPTISQTMVPHLIRGQAALRPKKHSRCFSLFVWIEGVVQLWHCFSSSECRCPRLTTAPESTISDSSPHLTANILHSKFTHLVLIPLSKIYCRCLESGSVTKAHIRTLRDPKRSLFAAQTCKQG